MKAWKFGFVALVLACAGACGDSGSSDSNGSTSNNNTGGTQTDGGATGGGTTSGTGSNTGNTTAGGNTGASTQDGGSASGTSTGSSTGSSTGANTGTSTGSGACTNAADKAIIDSLKAEVLACRSAGCALESVSGLSIDETKLSMCVAKQDGLKDLSEGCRQCFVDISLCVPKKCTLLGGNPQCNDTSKPDCSNPKPPAAGCADCQAKMCQPAFEACSGITAN